MIGKIRSNIRIFLAVLLLVSSLALIFGVVGGIGTSNTDGVTTLQYGLQLDGGTRFTVPLHGVTATDADIDSTENTPQLSRDIASELSITPSDVNIISEVNERAQTRTFNIEVTSNEITQDQLQNALDSLGVEYESIREGVTGQTREQTVNIIENKINQAGLSGGQARVVTSATGQKFVSIEVPGQDRSDVRSVLEDRGQVQVDVYYPVQGEDGREYETIEAVLRPKDFQSIGTAQFNPELGDHVPVTLTRSAATDFRDAVDRAGMLPSGSRCLYETAPNQTGPCLLTKVDGEVVYSAGMSPNLASSIATGNWVEAPEFVLQSDTAEQARSLSIDLNAGALPTGLDFENGTSAFISPTQGEQFKLASLIIGLAALFGVSIKVYVRYKDLRVVAPMIAMSITEVIVLLGFAALVGYPIDLAVVAGFVAVIGTGVDDLIIVANETLKKGDVTKSRVFRNRYDKAFWIILAAAITTGVALAPLVVLSLGQLSGFAIFTIFGIIVGVSITRPAYGRILESLLTD